MENNCSKSCTKAGVLALILSALAWVLIPSLERLKPLESLDEYYRLRLILKHEINKLEVDPCWINYLESELGKNEIKKVRLYELLWFYCSGNTFRSRTDKPPKYQFTIDLRPNPVSAKHSTGAPVAPPAKKDIKRSKLPPPKNLSLLTALPYFGKIRSILDTLINRDMLLKASEFSNSTRFRINKWDALRAKLVWVGRADFGKIYELSQTEEISMEEASNLFFTYENLAELANIEDEELSDYSISSRESLNPTIPWINSRLYLRSARTVTILSIFLSLAYFWLFQRESRSFSNHPPLGTLLRAISKDRYSFILFTFLAAIPSFSAGRLAGIDPTTFPIHMLNNIPISPDRFFAGLCVLFTILIVIEAFKTLIYQSAKNNYVGT